MPGFDKTGPTGAGPMTGGARGVCNPVNEGNIPRGSARFGYGRGLGLRRGFRGGSGGAGRGRGFGRGYGFYRPAVGTGYSVDTGNEMDALKAEADFMQRSLDAINKRMGALDQASSESS